MEDGRPLRYDEGRQNEKLTDEGRSLRLNLNILSAMLVLSDPSRNMFPI